jgi:hypothetical protein
MNVKKIRSKKALKFLGLLISAMLIATVSAQVYLFMFIDGSISITGAKMVWIKGDQTPADAVISGSTVTIDLDVTQGTPQNFSDVLYAKNTNASGSFNYYINVTNPVLASDFQRAYMHIFKNSSGSWAFADTLDLTNSGDYYQSTLAFGNYLEMRFEVNATASTGTFEFDIQLRYWA